MPSPSSLRKNLSLGTLEGVAATPVVFLTAPGNLLVAYLLTDLFPMGDTFFGTIVSLTSWFNVAQFFIAGWLRRHCSAKGLSLGFCWVQIAVWLVLLFSLPHLPQDRAEPAQRLFFILFAISSASGSIIGVMWGSWVQEWVPAALRGKYFGQRNSVLQIANILFLLAVGEVLQRFGGEHRILGFQIIIGVSMALRVVSILIQMRIHAPPQKQPEEHDTDTRSQLRCLAASSPYVWTVAFGTLWALTTSFFGPFFMRFMIEGLEMQANEINRLIIISNVTGALSLPAIGHLIDRHGGRAVLMFSMVATLVPSMTWCLATPDRNGFLVWLWVSGGIWNAAILLAQFNLLLKVVPVGAKTLAVSLNVALSALASAMAPIAGGAALEHLRASGVSALNAYQILALIHHILPLSCLLVLRRIQEPKSTSFNELFGAMRSGRTIAALLGATFLQNYILVRRRRRGGD